MLIITCATFSGSVLYSVCMGVYTICACVSQYMILYVIRIYVCACISISYSTRHIVRLMEDLIFFVICKETSQATQRPSALTEEGVPDRDRQKLIREQEVLKEVCVCVGGGVSILCKMPTEVYRTSSPNIYISYTCAR